MSMKNISERNMGIILIMGVAAFSVISYVNVQILATSMSSVIQSYLAEVFRDGDSQAFRDASEVIRKAVCEKSLGDDLCAFGFYGSVWQSVSNSVDRLDKTLKELRNDAVCLDEISDDGIVSFKNAGWLIETGNRRKQWGSPQISAADLRQSATQFKNSLDQLEGCIATMVGAAGEACIVSLKRGNLTDGDWHNSNSGQYFQIGFIERVLVNGKGNARYVYPDKGKKRFFYFKVDR